MSSTSFQEQEFVSQLQYVEKLIAEKRLEDAARMLNTLAKSAPRDPRLFLLGSLMAEAANNPAGMLTAAQKAVEMAPGWPVATIRLAAAYAAQDLAGLPALNNPEGPAFMAVQTAQDAVFEATQANTLDVELLTRAAVIAFKCKQYPQASLWAEQASGMAPDNRQLQHLKAEAMAYNAQFDEAIAVYNELLSTEPDNPTLLLDRVMAYLHTGQTDLAQKDIQQLLAMEPDNETYQYYHTIAQGQTPKTLPASVVAPVFDAYAPSFDVHLVAGLKYTLPQVVAQKILEWHPNRKVDVLDLGCGTGLLGACLGPVDGVIVGVDLSAEMIAKAHRHQVYAQFHKINALDALKATPGDHYDIITALDMLIYVGDLAPVIPNAHRILTPGGRFVFSCEAAPEDVETYVLQRTTRYAHRKEHVLQMLKDAGFKDIQIEDRTLRLERGEPVPGFLAVAQK